MNIREGKEIEKNYYSLGMLIRMGRLHAGINQDDFAREVGVSVTTLSKWETDASRPTARNLRKLEAIFNMTLTPGPQEPPVFDKLQHAEEKRSMDIEWLQNARAMIVLLDTNMQQLKLLMGELDRIMG